MILVFLLLQIFFQGSAADDICYKDIYRHTIFGPYLDTTSFKCADSCCGDNFSRYCCPSEGWSVAAIVGVTIGSIIGLCAVIALIICLIKICTKSGSQGRVVQPSHNLSVWATTSGTYPGTTAYYTATAGMPPFYEGPNGISHPTPIHSSTAPPLPTKGSAPP